VSGYVGQVGVGQEREGEGEGGGQDAVGAFARSFELFEQMVARLADPESAQLTHTQLEDELGERSRELTRSLYQDHLHLRAVREQRCEEPVVSSDGVERTRVEADHQRRLATVFGTVTASRLAYRAPGVDNLYPADAVLNLPAGLHSHGLRRLAVLEAVRGSYDQAVAAVHRTTGVRVGKRQLQRLVAAAAVDLPGFYAQREPLTCPDTDALIMTYDGKGVVMRPEALRAATARAAKRSQHKLSTRLSAGEKRNRKRIAEVAGVYDATPAPRRPGDIIARPGTTNQDQADGPNAANKWLTASITDDIPTVIAAGFDEATRRDPDHHRSWVALVDGNTTQIETITAQATRHEVQVTIIVDFIHVLEYLWKAAWSFFYPGDPDAETWVADQATKILHGKAATVAAGIRRRATRSGYSTSERNGADTAADYLTRKQPYLDYPTALANGWPIATGVIEGACRHLVKDRMDLTGARWGLPGAETILALRALHTNDDFDTYWAYHLTQEHHRTHHTKYRDEHLPAA
jgi:hypothetical protein